MSLICKNLRIDKDQVLVDIGSTENDGCAGSLTIQISGYPDKAKLVYLNYPAKTESLPLNYSDKKNHTITAVLEAGGKKAEKKIFVEL